MCKMQEVLPESRDELTASQAHRLREGAVLIEMILGKLCSAQARNEIVA